MEEIEFFWGKGAAAVYEQARLVRRQVFCEEQGYSLIGEFDDRDAECLHVVGTHKALGPVCAARMFEEEPGVYHIGRVAVLPALRGEGLGRRLVAQMIARARQAGARAIVLNAQADKYAFYEKCGFVLTGKTLLDEGQPHVEMEHKFS